MDSPKKSASFLSGLSTTQKISGLAAIALAAAFLVVSIMWGNAPSYKILFAGVGDKDGGQIVSALDQLKVPYEQSDGGVFKVPASRVHEVRMKLASQGIPKGSGGGFELLDGPKLGMSQFGEQMNYQRALEGEIAKTIQSIASVQSARVHLAIPKQSVFARDGLQPTASVFLSLYPGHSLDRNQVAGIVNLVAGSVPQMAAKMVSIVDQNGEPLNNKGDTEGIGMSSDQLSLQRRIEHDLTTEVDAIVEPIVGPKNVRSKVRVEMDFSKSDETTESFSPNSGAEAKQSIRSSQSLRTNSSDAASSGGIPGSFSNTPPAPTTAPMTAGKVPPPPSPADAPKNSSDQSVTNYELDRTVRNIKGATGTIKRVTVAVVVNDKDVVGADGKKTKVPLSDAELAKIDKLVKQVVGFSDQRGDVVNVAGASFSAPAIEAVEESPLWKDPEVVAVSKDVGRNALMIIAGLLVFFGVIRPLVRRVTAPATVASGTPKQSASQPRSAAPPPEPKEKPATFESDLEDVRKIALNDPASAADIIKDWTKDSDE